MLINRNPRSQLSASAHVTVPSPSPRNVKVIKANYTNSQKIPIFQSVEPNRQTNKNIVFYTIGIRGTKMKPLLWIKNLDFMNIRIKKEDVDQTKRFSKSAEKFGAC